MDIGQSDNTFSKKTSADDTGSTGLFKIGDYDKKPEKTGGADTTQGGGDEGSLVQQTINTVKNQAQALSDTVTGNSNSNSNKK